MNEMNKAFPVSEPDLNEDDVKSVEHCLKLGWVSGEGPVVNEFEESFANYCGRKYAVACSSGSAALDLAIESVGWKKNDEIIVPAFSIISTISQCIRNECKLKFIDSDPQSWNVNLEKLISAITENTRGIIIPHIYGLCNDMEYLSNLCQKRGIVLIEDAAEVHGQHYPNSKRISGSLGDLSCFSFYSNKIITCGEGGMILTDSFDLFQKLKYYRNLCFDEKKRFFHQNLGWNYRMNSMSAALGNSQLKRIDSILEKKRKIGEWYSKYFKKFSDYVVMQPLVHENIRNIFWVNGFLLNESCGVERAPLTRHLNSLNVGVRPFFYPLHKQNLNLNVTDVPELPVSEYLGDKGFYLPSSNTLTAADVEEISYRFEIALKRCT